MSFYIAETMSRLLAPRHELSCSWMVWRRLLAELHLRGDGRHESGAFLLGRRSGGRVRLVDFVPYDDLDPHCLDTGIVRFDGRYFGHLWTICRERGLTVVADVHTHPDGAGQSPSDRANPMIGQAGHVALIVPNFADGSPKRRSIGIYRYRCNHEWDEVPADRRHVFLHIGF
jgi:proteasome lid subunit RPN8/RPN11